VSAAWPLVVNRLLVLVPGLSGWSSVVVSDGKPVTGDDLIDYFTVGFVEGEDFGGNYEQTYSPGGLLEEAGTVRCELVTVSGDVDLAARRARAFALIDALQASVFADPTLGVLPQSSSASLSVDPQPVQNDRGSAQRATVTVSYLARGL
jgi:hypothetical protein